MKKISYLLFLASVAFAISCSKNDSKKHFCLNGVWELQQMTTPAGSTYIYPENGFTWMRIYDDSCYYACQIANAPNGTMITPSVMQGYTFVDKGNNNILYLQGDNTHPLTIINDSTMIIQEMGRKYTWRFRENFDEDRCHEIVGVIKNDIEDNNETTRHYVFSKAEKELQTTNHTLIYILIFIVMALMMILNYAHNLYKNKKRVEQELKQIEQVHEALPEPVRQAMNTVETEFHQSDFYISLRKRIANGERMNKEDWEMIDTHFKSVYPRFTSTLLSLYNMSQVEYQVCLLLKLNAAPSEIANVLCKDTSSISSIRSRLYQKVFSKKGSSKDWDEFIHSL